MHFNWLLFTNLFPDIAIKWKIQALRHVSTWQIKHFENKKKTAAVAAATAVKTLFQFKNVFKCSKHNKPLHQIEREKYRHKKNNKNQKTSEREWKKPFFIIMSITGSLVGYENNDDLCNKKNRSLLNVTASSKQCTSLNSSICNSVITTESSTHK